MTYTPQTTPQLSREQRRNLREMRIEEDRLRQRDHHVFQHNQWYIGHFSKAHPNYEFALDCLDIEGLGELPADGEVEIEFRYQLASRLEPGCGVCRIALLDRGEARPSRWYEMESHFTKVREASIEEVTSRLIERKAARIRRVKLKQTLEALQEYLPEAVPMLLAKYSELSPPALPQPSVGA